MRLENVRKPDENGSTRIEQKLEGKTYVWEEAGDVMTVPDGVGGWLLGKLNNRDSNPAIERGEQWLKMLPTKPTDQQVAPAVIRAEKARKVEEPKAPIAPKVPPAAPSK